MTEIELETYLADDAWLRRLARRLVADPDAADDLVQEVWVQRLGSDGHRSRAWLGGVLRNVGRRFFRTRTREGKRIEEFATIDRATESSAAADVASELQLRERVATELLNLDEPYRSAVHLVHVRGLTLARAAEVEGVATSTMGDRVSRGIELLRSRLDRAFHGDRSRWSAALVAVAARPEGAAAGGLATRGLVAGLVAVAAATVLAITWKSVEHRRSAAATDIDLATIDEPPAEPETLSPVVPAHQREVGSSTRPTVAAAQSKPSLAVRIVRPDGEPAAGATWTLRRHAADDKKHAPLEGTVPEDGWVRIRFSVANIERLNLFVREEGVGIARWTSSARPLHRFTELGTIALLPVTTVIGRVVDASGDPVLGHAIGVSVSLRPADHEVGRDFRGRNATVDPATGEFEIADVPIGSSRLTMRLEAWRSGATAIDVARGEPKRLDVEAVGLTEALATIRISLRTQPPHTARTIEAGAIALVGADGTTVVPTRDRLHSLEFTAPELTASSYTIFVEDPRFEPWRRDDVAPGSYIKANLRSRSVARPEVAVEHDSFATWSVTGIVRSSTGAPLADIEIVLARPAATDDGLHTKIVDDRAFSSRAGQLRKFIGHVRSDAEGKFELEAPEAGAYVVVARTSRGAIAQSDALELETGVDVPHVELVASPVGKVAGRVRLPDYVDPTGWSVQVDVEGEPADALLEDRRMIDVDGRFDLGPIGVGTLRLYLFQPGTPTMWSPGGITGAYRLDTFELTAGASIDRDFPWPDPAPMFVTFDVSLPEGIAAVDKVWLTGQPVQGQPPHAKGPGPIVGPVIAAALPYGVAASGDGWAYWSRNFVPANAGVTTIPLTIEVERRRVRVLVDGEPWSGPRRLRVQRENEPHPFAALTFFECDEDGYADVALSEERYRFSAVGASLFAVPGSPSSFVDWPVSDAVLELVSD